MDKRRSKKTGVSSGVIIAFDLSLNSTGYAIFNKKGVLLEKGFIDTKHENETPLKLLIIWKKIKEIDKRYKVLKIVIERGFTRFNKVTQQLFRVVGIVNLFFAKIEQEYITSKEVRKIVCGNGNIKKNDFFGYITENFPNINFYCNDEADAYALGVAYFIKNGVLDG